MAVCQSIGKPTMGMPLPPQMGPTGMCVQGITPSGVAPPCIWTAGVSCVPGLPTAGMGGPGVYMPGMAGLGMQNLHPLPHVTMPDAMAPGTASSGMGMAMESAPGIDLPGKGTLVKGGPCFGMQGVTMHCVGMPSTSGSHGEDVGKGGMHGWQWLGQSSGGDRIGFANLGVVLPPKKELLAMAANGMSKDDILKRLGSLGRTGFFGRSVWPGVDKGACEVWDGLALGAGGVSVGVGKPASISDNVRRDGPKKPNPPEKLFVGGLPLSVTETGLRDFLAGYGKVKSIQLKYDAAGNFKGFAFITFESCEVAEKLCNTKGLVYEGSPIDFRRPLAWSGPGDSSPKEARIFVGGLPKTTTKEAVESYFSQYGRVASIKMKYDSEGNLKGFAFVTFEDKLTAEVACSAKCHKFEGKAIDCRLADSEQPVDPHDKVFVGGLPKDTTEEEIMEHFSEFGVVVSIDMKYDDKTGRFRGFCFVTFESQLSAEAVYRSASTFKNRPITCRPSVRKPAIDSAVSAVMAAQAPPAVGASPEDVAVHQQYTALGASLVPTVGTLAPWADEKAVQRARSVALRQGLSGLLGSVSLAAQASQYGPMSQSGAPDRPSPF